MKKYIAPEFEISKFAMQDVVTTSGDPVPALEIGGTASMDGGYSKNDLKWSNEY